ncbi:MAG: cytochrome c oxidase subunit II [Novosphingobium sp.]
MTLGHTVREAGNMVKALALGLALLAAPGAALAAPAAATAAPAAAASAPATDAAKAVAAPVVAASPAAPAAPAINPNDPHFKVAPGGYTPLPAVQGVGMPIPGAMNVQEQFSPVGHRAKAMHDWLIWVMVGITAFVLALLLYVIIFFNKRANPVPSKTAHNTLLEVVWTGVPILILVAIAVPSVGLLRAQFKPAPKDALTIKAVGNQWYWTYEYPDNGKIEVISNMLKEAGETQPGEKARTDADGPEHLAVDNRMVVPVGEDIRLQTTGADVIHAFAVPSLWFKLDAIPGRLNEKVLRIEKPGVYFGQCSELCGVKHGYMPIVVEALPRDKFNAWVIAQGGTIDGAPAAPAAPAASPAPAPTTAAPAAAKPAA